VEQAVFDLDRQQTQLRLAAHTLLLDVVIQAPPRFSSAVRSALEDELPMLRPAVVRARFHLAERADVEAAVEVLDRVGRRGRVSHGVVLKAPDHPAVVSAIGRLTDRGIPVVTLVTDVRDSTRVAYAGIDNVAAGATAAYLVAQVLGDRPGDVLLTLSRSLFFGERERADAFTTALSELAPGRRGHIITGSDGLDATMSALVCDLLAAHGNVRAVYSIGGGNRAISAAFTRAGRPPPVFVAHDLDDDNLELLRSGVLTAVLHHDLHADMRAVVRQVMRAHHLVPGSPTSVAANVEVVTAYNIPSRIHVR